MTYDVLLCRYQTRPLDPHSNPEMAFYDGCCMVRSVPEPYAYSWAIGWNRREIESPTKYGTWALVVRHGENIPRGSRINVENREVEARSWNQGL